MIIIRKSSYFSRECFFTYFAFERTVTAEFPEFLGMGRKKIIHDYFELSEYNNFVIMAYPAKEKKESDIVS